MDMGGSFSLIGTLTFPDAALLLGNEHGGVIVWLFFMCSSGCLDA